MSRPRIRSLKPELWQDEKVGSLCRDARLLFVGLVTMADDEGRLRALPALILGHVFPYDADALRKVDGWLEEVAASGLVTRYVVGGTPYIEITGWRKHQVINRPTSSDLPPVPLSEDPRSAPASIPEPSSLVRTHVGADRNGSEGKGTPPRPPASGGRQRDKARFTEELRAWAAATYSDLPVDAVVGAVHRLRSANVAEHDLTPERIRTRALALAEQQNVHPLPTGGQAA